MILDISERYEFLESHDNDSAFFADGNDESGFVDDDDNIRYPILNYIPVFIICKDDSMDSGSFLAFDVENNEWKLLPKLRNYISYREHEQTGGRTIWRRRRGIYRPHIPLGNRKERSASLFLWFYRNGKDTSSNLLT